MHCQHSDPCDFSRDLLPWGHSSLNPPQLLCGSWRNLGPRKQPSLLQSEMEGEGPWVFGADETLAAEVFVFAVLMVIWSQRGLEAKGKLGKDYSCAHQAQ